MCLAEYVFGNTVIPLAVSNAGNLILEQLLKLCSSQEFQITK